MPQLTDETLLSQLSRDSEKAFSEIYTRYAQRVTAFVFCLLKSREKAMDITQDIFTQLWSRRSSMSEVDSLSGYLFKMAKNAVLNVFSHEMIVSRYNEKQLETADIFNDETISGIQSRDLLMLIDIAIEQMPRQRRTIFRMSRIEHLTYPEIADRLGIKEKAVEYQMSLALKDLRKLVTCIAVFFAMT